MTRLIPHPLLSVCLVVIWMMLTAFSPGHFLLGTAIALFAGWAMAALHPPSIRIRRWSVIPKLIWTLFFDILRSNADVARLILTDGRNNRRSAFLFIDLKLKNPNALAALAIIVTSTPGTAWVEYSSASNRLILHIFDAAQADHYHHVVSDVYEPMLMEIFE